MVAFGLVCKTMLHCRCRRRQYLRSMSRGLYRCGTNGTFYMVPFIHSFKSTFLLHPVRQYNISNRSLLRFAWYPVDVDLAIVNLDPPSSLFIPLISSFNLNRTANLSVASPGSCINPFKHNFSHFYHIMDYSSFLL